MKLPLTVIGVSYANFAAGHPFEGWSVYDSSMNYVAIVVSDKGTRGRDLIGTKEEAKYIVKAVNNHEALLSALKTAEAILYAHGKPIDPAITAAIANAEKA